jgi:plastocyanin
MRVNLLVGSTLVAAGAVWSCGGGGSTSGPTPTAPMTVTIVSSAGNGAFNPNPVQAATGTTITWKNNTSDIHRLVMDDGLAVIGDIQPGASSAPMQSRSGNYHCTIHPSMVGNINGSMAPTPAPGSGGGY